MIPVHPPPLPHCLVLGNNSLGAAVACRLRWLGYPVYFLGRKGPQFTKIRLEAWGQTHYVDAQTLARVDLRPIQVMFVTVNAYDLLGAMDRHLPYLPHAKTVVVLSPGVIGELMQELSKRYLEVAWRWGLCTAKIQELSPGIHRLQADGPTLWGPVPPAPVHVELGALETQILHFDEHVWFRWHGQVTDLIRYHWLTHLVVDSLCAGLAIAKHGDLLLQMSLLQEVFQEGVRLGGEVWGPWHGNTEARFHELLHYLATTATEENIMVRQLAAGEPTHNDYLANLAVNRRGYEQLTALATSIARKSK